MDVYTSGVSFSTVTPYLFRSPYPSLPCRSLVLHPRHQHTLDSEAVAHFNEMMLDYSLPFSEISKEIDESK